MEVAGKGRGMVAVQDIPREGLQGGPRLPGSNISIFAILSI